MSELCVLSNGFGLLHTRQMLIAVDLLTALVTEFSNKEGSAELGRPVEFHYRSKLLFEVRSLVLLPLLLLLRCLCMCLRACVCADITCVASSPLLFLRYAYPLLSPSFIIVPRRRQRYRKHSRLCCS